MIDTGDHCLGPVYAKMTFPREIVTSVTIELRDWQAGQYLGCPVGGSPPPPQESCSAYFSNKADVRDEECDWRPKFGESGPETALGRWILAVPWRAEVIRQATRAGQPPWVGPTTMIVRVDDVLVPSGKPTGCPDGDYLVGLAIAGGARRGEPRGTKAEPGWVDVEKWVAETFAFRGINAFMRQFGADVDPELAAALLADLASGRFADGDHDAACAEFELRCLCSL